MRYCRACVSPDSRPNLDLGPDGVCNACVAAREKRTIDWPSRRQAFQEVIRNAKARARTYDCLIPVSGGKDSTWQVVTCLEAGLRPLAVTWKSPARNSIGARNLANLVRLGGDHLDFQINLRGEKTVMLEALRRHGSTAIPMHLAIFTLPLALACRFEIPLVVWGENSAFEYGGSEDERRGFRMDAAWIRKFGVTQGTTAADWVSDRLTREELTPYFGPTDEELAAKGVLAVFLGYYFPWDPAESLRVALAHGFQPRAEGPKTGYYDYADIDDDFISIHHYLKWYKFGIDRLFDNLSVEIRNGRMTRDEAVRIIRKRGDQTPHQDIDAFCRFAEITREQFFETIEQFRNPKIWVRENGRWTIPGFLIPDWSWA